VMSYNVSQRTTEIGIRLAVGADPFKTLGMIVREGWRLAAIAASLGMLVAIAITVATLHVNGSAASLKALPLIAPYFLILVFATAACVLPARRAALVDPMVALRPESPQSLRTTLRLLLRAPQRILRSSMRRRAAQRSSPSRTISPTPQHSPIGRWFWPVRRPRSSTTSRSEPTANAGSANASPGCATPLSDPLKV